ncbi:MAG: efflux RND transporter periplasmic adaptor subunit [Pseudomonadota bacterium]
MLAIFEPIFHNVSKTLCILFTAFIMALIDSGSTVYGEASSAQGKSNALPVATSMVTLQNSYSATRRFPGRINAAQVSDVGFQVSGEVAEVLVEVGDRVAKGDKLALLVPERLQLRLGELEAARAEAQAIQKRAESELKRIQGLFEDGFIRKQDLDDAIATRDASAARVRQLTRNIENANVDLEDATLRAPFKGVIVNRYLDAGVIVTPGQPIIRLNKKGILEALIGVPVRFARNISIGDQLQAFSRDLRAAAIVKGIGDEVNLATQTVTIRLEIINDPGFIPGGLVRLELTEERRTRGAWIPALALSESYRGLWSVFVVDDIENDIGTIVRKDIEIIHIGNQRVYVRGTLEDGDRVVAAAPFRFVPGQRVQVVDTAKVSPPHQKYERQTAAIASE